MKTAKRFSERHGHGPGDIPITIRTDAPREVRETLLALAEGELGLRPRYLRSVLCAALRKTADSDNWSEYPNMWAECRSLIDDAPWYRVYDFVELLYERLVSSPELEKAGEWQQLVNKYFIEAGVGWRMVGGSLEARGSEAFQLVLDSARESLQSEKTQTAMQEISEAVRDLSRRPAPDLTGAVQHGMAALECIAREVAGDRRATLGDIIKRYPNLFPKPLDEAISRMWGFASGVGRHLQEGRQPEQAEAELVVGIAAVACNYLRYKLEGDV
jgi:hypothetical protein